MTYLRKLITFLIFSCLFLASPAYAELREVPFISIMAASSLTLPLTELSRYYSATSGITVNVTYDSSIELANQLEKGEHVDIFISSSDYAINMLKRNDLVDIRTTTEIARNKLALIASNDNIFAKKNNQNLSPRQLMHTISSRSMLVIGDPDSTPLGAYTREMMQNIGLWDRVKSLTIRAENARIALYMIAQGKTVGVSYYSDAFSSKEVTILTALPKKLYSPIIYKAIALEGKEKPFATQFIDFLSSPYAQAVLKRYGFEGK